MAYQRARPRVVGRARVPDSAMLETRSTRPVGDQVGGHYTVGAFGW